MNDLIGKLALSTKGRDMGNIYLIYKATINEVIMVDGNARKIINPKKKNIKHIKLLDVQSSNIREKIEKNLKVFDSEIYSFIKKYKKDWNFLNYVL